MGNQCFVAYIAGVVQASLNGEVVDQSYRAEIQAIILGKFPHAIVHDPIAGHENSITYDDDQAKARLDELLLFCQLEVDLMVVYLPEASMGSALEMDRAKNRAFIVVITPLTTNWVVRHYANMIVSSIEEFRERIESGAFEQYMESFIDARAVRRFDIRDVIAGLKVGRGYYRKLWWDDGCYGIVCYGSFETATVFGPWFIHDGSDCCSQVKVSSDDLIAEDWIEVSDLKGFVEDLRERGNDA